MGRGERFGQSAAVGGGAVVKENSLYVLKQVDERILNVPNTMKRCVR